MCVTLSELAADSSATGKRSALRGHEKGTMMPDIACNLDAASLRRRQHLLAALIARASERRELDSGYAFGFPPATVGLVELAQIIEPERRCCTFFRFVVAAEPEGGPIWLEVTGPDRTKEFLQVLLNLT